MEYASRFLVEDWSALWARLSINDVVTQTWAPRGGGISCQSIVIDGECADALRRTLKKDASERRKMERCIRLVRMIEKKFFIS